MEEEIQRSDDGRICTNDTYIHFWKSPAYAGGNSPYRINEQDTSTRSMKGIDLHVRSGFVVLPERAVRTVQQTAVLQVLIRCLT